MADAIYVRPRDEVRITLDAAMDPGELRQLPDGRAAVFNAASGLASGDRANFSTTGQYVCTKTASVVLLDGGRAYWDHSANAITFRKVNDRDFYVGRVVGDAASADTTCVVNLNVDPPYDIDMLRDGALSVATGTAAAGGFGLPQVYGGVRGLSLTATNEAQCVDMLSVDRVAVASNPIAEFEVRLGANGSTSAVDINIGLANGTSTTDADAITESVFFHIDGGALDILAESDDGTTEVNATDTTVDITAGSAVANRFYFWIDARDPASVKLYVNGVRVLSGSTFVLTAATGPIGLLAHLEKSSSTATAGPIYIDRACLRIAQQ
jgi:predicted RecA/RadA family phage recombinase